MPLVLTALKQSKFVLKWWQWDWWLLKSVSTRVFVQQANIKRKHQSSMPLALCEGNPPVTDGFPSQRASNWEIISISWWHHVMEYIGAVAPGHSDNWSHGSHFVVFSFGTLWASYQICKIAGCACAGNAGNIFTAVTGWRSWHASWHKCDAHAVMHAGITN